MIFHLADFNTPFSSIDIEHNGSFTLNESKRKNHFSLTFVTFMRIPSFGAHLITTFHCAFIVVNEP